MRVSSAKVEPPLKSTRSPARSLVLLTLFTVRHGRAEDVPELRLLPPGLT